MLYYFIYILILHLHLSNSQLSFMSLQTIIGTDIADLLLAGHEPSTHDYAVSGIRINQSQSQSADPLDVGEEDSRSSSPAVRVSAERTLISAAQQLEESTDRFRNLLLYGRKKVSIRLGV